MIQFSITNCRRLACGEHLRIRVGCFLKYRRPMGHPLRKIRELVREVLSELNCSLGKPNFITAK